MSDEIVIYGIPGSPFLRAVQMGLEEKGAAYRLEAMGPGESKTEAHLKRHPFGRVPAFQHGNFGLYETQAILRYLDDVFAEPPFEPTDSRAAARMNQIIGMNDWYFFPKAAAPIVFNRIIGPALLGTAADEAVIAAAVPNGWHLRRRTRAAVGRASVPGGQSSNHCGSDPRSAAGLFRRDPGRRNSPARDATRILACSDERACEHAGHTQTAGFEACRVILAVSVISPPPSDHSREPRLQRRCPL
jgi:glutathione S-transferase